MTTTSSDDRRVRSYAAASTLTRERMRRDDPDAAKALEEIEASDVVVVRGTYDHVETVLGALDLPHTVIGADDLARVRLRPEQLLVVNCPGNISRQAIDRMRSFVERGGSLFTTDWALRNVVEPCFPGVLAYNDRPTADTVVRIEIVTRDNPFLAGVLDGDDDPQWWLEGSSYPITILDRERVEVLLRSRELERNWGESPVAVLFRHGDGEVFHMISHYYLQRTETRSARHRGTATSYFAEKGVPVAPGAMPLMEDLSLGEVESAATSARLFANVVAEKRRKRNKR